MPKRRFGYEHWEKVITNGTNLADYSVVGHIEKKVAGDYKSESVFEYLLSLLRNSKIGGRDDCRDYLLDFAKEIYNKK